MGDNRNRAAERREVKKPQRRYVPKSKRPVEIADWMNVDATLIQAVIATVALQGGAVRFGYTRDGGAYAVGIYGDGEPYTLYGGTGDDIEQILREVGEAFTTNPDGD